jgi:threonine/homoserine/homoserine lactone efflux protein
MRAWEADRVGPAVPAGAKGVGAAAADAQAGAKLMFLGFYFIALAVPVCAGLVIAAERVVASLRQSRKVMGGFDWLFAGLMAAFALKLVLSRAE